MISKEKIKKLDIYSEDGSRLLTTTNFTFPRDFFKIRGFELVSVRGKDLPELNKDVHITAVFEYLNGTRVKCDSRVDISTHQQMNFHVDEGVVLEERRRSFKVNTTETAYIIAIERGEEVIEPEERYAATIRNINLGGIFLECDMDFIPSDVVTIIFLPDNMEVRIEILRIQLDNNGNRTGYGCQFIGITQAQEERLARHLLECQIAEREKLRKKEGGRR